MDDDETLQQGFAALINGDVIAAKQLFARCVEEEETDSKTKAWALIGRAKCLQTEGNLQEALVDFGEALGSDGTQEQQAEGLIGRAEICLEMGEYQDALESLEIGLGLEAVSLHKACMALLKSKAHYALEDFESALREVSRAIHLDPNGVGRKTEAWNLKVLCLNGLGRLMDSVDTFHHAADVLQVPGDKNMDMILNTAIALEGLGGDLNACIGMLNRALVLVYDQHADDITLTADIWRRRSGCWVSKGLIVNGLRDALIALELVPDVEQSTIQVARCAFGLGLFSLAHYVLDQACRDNPDNVEPRWAFVTMLLSRTSSGPASLKEQAVMKQKRTFQASELDRMIRELDDTVEARHLDIADLSSCLKVDKLSDLIAEHGLNFEPILSRLFVVNVHDSAVLKTSQLQLCSFLADQYGHLLQLDCPGFSVNLRQHRQAGLAMIQLAQLLRDKSKPAMSYRDWMHHAVRWRQVSEPWDLVFWIDELNSFENGFGLETPIIRGQFHVPRYAMYEKPLLEILLSDLSGSPVVKKCGNNLEGMHISQTEGNLSICVPSTPERWSKFEVELNRIFHQLQGELEMVQVEQVVNLALEFFFFWVNFSPLTRGSASTGLVALFAILLSFDIPLPDGLPSGKQLDWEALLSPTLEEFLSKTKPWLLEKPGPEKNSIFAQIPNLSLTFYQMFTCLNF